VSQVLLLKLTGFYSHAVRRTNYDFGLEQGFWLLPKNKADILGPSSRYEMDNVKEPTTA